MQDIQPDPGDQPDLLVRLRSEVIRGARSRRFLLFGLSLPLGVYVGYTVTGLGGPVLRTLDGVAWPSWLMVAMAAFGAMSAATVSAARPMPGARPAGGSLASAVFIRGGSAWLLAVPPVVLLGLAGGLAGIRLPIAEWALLVVELWVGVLPFVALGLLVGALVDRDSEDVVLLGMLVVLAVLGGLFQPVGTLPAELAVIARVLPSYHLAELGWTSVAGLAGDPLDVVVLASYTLVLGAIFVWRESERGRAGT